MRHKKGYVRLGRDAGHRKATLRNLAASLIANERIETTLPKAKALRPYIERLVTFGKRGDLHGRRLVIARLGNRHVANRLVEEIAPRFTGRPGGYTRIIKTRFRKGDNAPMAIIEFVEDGQTDVTPEQAPAQEAAE